MRAFSFAKGGMVAAARTHNQLLQVVLHLPVTFFDSTPVGWVLNRFSSDTGVSRKLNPYSGTLCRFMSFLCRPSHGHGPINVAILCISI